LFSRRRIALIGNVVTDHHFGIVSVAGQARRRNLEAKGTFAAAPAAKSA